MYQAEIPGDETHGLSSREVILPVSGSRTMPGYLALPEGGSGPGIVVVCDSTTGTEFFEGLAVRIADLGYVALCPRPSHGVGRVEGGGPGHADEDALDSNELEMLADLNAIITWLEQRPEVTTKTVGAIGFGPGGTLVLNLAATRRDIVTVCFYGSPRGSSGPAVTVPAPLELVDEMSGPMIGFWGEDDDVVGREGVDALITALSERDLPFHSVTYPHVGHGFMADDPKDDRTTDARRHAWARMTAFLRRHLAED